jgi:cell division protein FtsB
MSQNTWAEPFRHRNKQMKSRRTTLHLLVIVTLFLAACGTIEVGIIQEPSSNPDVEATVAVLATENAYMQTRVAELRAQAKATDTPVTVATAIPTDQITPEPPKPIPGPALSATSSTVCPSGCDYASIQAAVDMAMPGDIIYIDAGTYVENVIIGKDLTLQGAGAAYVIVSGGASGTVFTIEQNDTVTVVIADLTITNGICGVKTAPGSHVTLNRCIVTGNVGGGGIVNDFAGTLTLNSCTISDNLAEDNGGGIPNGGGISNVGISLVLNDTTVSNNTATSKGGGIANGVTSHCAVELINSTISGNHAVSGGGIWNSPTGEVTLRNCTVAYNQANREGGGISNVGGTVALQNTIIAANSPGDCVTTEEGVLSSLGHNLDGDGSCNLTAVGDLPHADPRLGPLQDNFGPTLTHALLEGSPAIDAGDVPGCLPSDQRTGMRPWDGDGDGESACDIGAFEYATFMLDPTLAPTAPFP